VQVHDPLIVTRFGIKSSPHRPFFRCKRPAVFTIAFVVMRKSLSVIIVIAVIAIVPKAVAKWPAGRHLVAPLESINKAAPVALIMPLVKNDFANKRSKK
jgi:hypothetical protein